MRGQYKFADKKLKASSILLQNSNPGEKFVKINNSKDTKSTLSKSAIRRQLSLKEGKNKKLRMDESGDSNDWSIYPIDTSVKETAQAKEYHI